VPIEPAARELLAALARVLAAWGPWYVFGAQAVVAYGVPRLSADVDVTIRLTPDTPSAFADAMQAGGFMLRVTDPHFVERTRVMPFVHTATGMPVDVVLAGSGLEDMFLDRVRSIDIGGTTVPMLDVEDLVIAKVLAGRPKDIDDAQALWRVHGSGLDAGRIRSVIRDLEDALSQSDLLPALDVVTGTAKRPSRN
jgi:Nucleotidyl transferase of unknown function (DUF2204)